MSATYNTASTNFFMAYDDAEVDDWVMKDPEDVDLDFSDEEWDTEWDTPDTTVTTVPTPTPTPTAPTMKPESPRPVLQEATMEIVETTKMVTVATMEIIVTETKRWKNPNRPAMGPRRRKVKAVTMSMGDFYQLCETETKAKAEADAAEQAKAEKNRLKRARANAKRNKGWNEVKVAKPEPIKVSIKFPRKKAKRTPPPAPTSGKFVNTTLVLKNLPYDGTNEKALTSFFATNCGEVRFVNVLRQEDGRSKGMAFVRFRNREGSDKGYQLNGFRYEGREISVDYARDRRE